MYPLAAGGKAGSLHVLDLPALHTRPSASVLLQTLDQLALKPADFDGTFQEDEDEARNTHIGDGLPRYITSIVSNKLLWIEDEALRERIWEAASTRLSERAGRNAMPSVNRTFKIPVLGSTGCAPISITLREPSLTADNLGHKTWAASYLLAKRLPLLAEFIIPLSTSQTKHLSEKQSMVPGPLPRILELGAGTGLVGIAAAALFASLVHLTDLPAIIENLAENCAANSELFVQNGSIIDSFPLDWNDQTSKISPFGAQYDVILASDPLYSEDHPALLADNMERYLKRSVEARVVVELPLREAYQPEVDDFRERMLGKGLEIVREGEEVGFDDWDGGRREVRCWWGVWGWKDASNI